MLLPQGMGNMNFGGGPPKQKKKPDKPMPDWKKKLKPGQLADFDLAAQQVRDFRHILDPFWGALEDPCGVMPGRITYAWWISY